MAWSMRYTFHAGYEPPTLSSQFRATLNGDDPVALVHFAAQEGAAGVLYPWASDRSATETAAVAEALRATGLVNSCLVAGESALHFRPIWSDRSSAGIALLTDMMRSSCKLARTLATETVVAFPVTDPAAPIEQQLEALVANLAAMAPIAKAQGCKIGLEPMALPMLLLQSLDSAVEVIRRVGSPDVGLIFDTGHVATMHGPDGLPRRLRGALPNLILLQLADLPGRVEPGVGTLDLVSVATTAIRGGYAGLVDFEHGWSAPGAQGESDGLSRLRSFDKAVVQALADENASINQTGERRVTEVHH